MSSQFDLLTYTNPPIRPLSVSGADFKDPDGATMRFWAANVVAFYPDQDTATNFARNLASCGVNMVRWHHLMRPSSDWNWTSQIPALSNYADNSSRADPNGKDQVAWDRFDRLTAELHENGIYIMLSFDFTRTFLPGDVTIMTTTPSDAAAWSAAIQQLGDWSNAAWFETIDKWRMLPMIDERCARLQEEFITQLLTRNNAYLGKTYGVSEQILAIEIQNECSSFYTIVNGNRFEHSSYPALSYFRNALLAKWNTYLSANGVSPAFDLYAPANDTQQSIRAAFLNKLDADHRDRILAKVSSLGFSRNVSFSNLWRSESDAKAHFGAGVFSENHNYLPASIVDPMPYTSLFGNGGASPEAQEDFVYAFAAENAFTNKPFIVGELNYAIGASGADRDRRTMMQLAAAGYGVLQGWSAVTWFAWNHGDRRVAFDGWGSDERLSPSEDEIAGDIIQDAARLDHFRTCAALFRNGLLADSSAPLTYTVDDPVWNSFGWPPAPKYKFRPGWQNRSRIRKQYGVKPAGQDSSALMTQNLANPIVSDNGQLCKDVVRKQFSIAAPKAEAFSGELDGSAPALLSHLLVADTGGFATAAVVSADGSPLSTSDHLLLSRNRVSGSVWQAGPSLKLRNLQPPTSSSSWYLRPLRPRGAPGVGELFPVAVDANGDLDLPASMAWREAELIHMTTSGTSETDVLVYTGDGSDLQAAINEAAAAGKALYISPGTYDVWNLGVGDPIRIFGTPGKVILRPVSGAAYVLYVGAFTDVTIEGIVFDGAGRTLSVDSGLATRSMLAVKRGRGEPSRIRIVNCTFRTSPHAGLQIYGVTARVENCRFEGVGDGVFVRDADGVQIVGNDFVGNTGNAIYVERLNGEWNGVMTPGFDGTLISGNHVDTVYQGDPSSTGWEGNGVLLLKAASVRVTDNVFRNCALSAVRANMCTDLVVNGNSCHGIGETALYVEAILSGVTELAPGFGAVVTGNLVDDAATGITLANFNFGGRLGVVQGNLLRNLAVKTIAAGTANQYSTGGCGIIVEGDTNVNGNVVENAARLGVVLGTNHYTDDLLCNGNLIRNSPIGIGFADAAATGGRDAQIFIASNMVAHFTDDASHGAIVPVAYNSSGYYRATGTDLGQVDTSTTYPNVRVDRNRCY